MTRLPVFRRCLRIYAVAAPALCYLAFVSMAAGHVLLPVMALFAAGFLHWASPLSEGSRSKSDESDKGGLGVIRIFAIAGITLWFTSRPEFRAFQEKLIDERLMLDWKLLAPAAVLTLVAMIRRWQRSVRLTDEDIYRFYAAEK